ncbi:MAG: hypothetical protein ABIB71_02630 [Candidatus Woesearchaeota archaeon]
MKKNMILGLALLSLLILTACSGIDVSKMSDEEMARIAEQAIRCDSPYIRVGTDCCLDQNSNRICDKDEREQQSEIAQGVGEAEVIGEELKEPLCIPPYFEYKTGDCCLDSNLNRVCDKDERSAEDNEKEKIESSTNKEESLKECIYLVDGSMLGLGKLCVSREDCVEYLISEYIEPTELKGVECKETSFKRIEWDGKYWECSSAYSCFSQLSLGGFIPEALMRLEDTMKSVRCKTGFCETTEFTPIRPVSKSPECVTEGGLPCWDEQTEEGDSECITEGGLPCWD